MFGFGDLFGGGAGAAARSAARDLRYDLEITFEESAQRRGDHDPDSAAGELRDVQGLGRGAGSAADRLPQCRGQGQVRFAAGLLHRRAHLSAVPRRRRDDHASRARPATAPGTVARERKITVKIPAGIATGQQLRLQGEGEAGIGGGPPGTSTSSSTCRSTSSSAATA